MPPIRLYDPELLHEVTQRVNCGSMIFDPNNKALQDAFIGVLALAQRRYGVKVLAFHFMSNHYHGLFQIPSAGKFTRFLAYFHAGLANAYHRLHDTQGKLWGYMKWMPVAPDEASVAKRLAYIMGQAVAAGQVAHPRQSRWASSVGWMLDRRPIAGQTFDATQRCRDRRRRNGPGLDETYARRLEVEITAPDCWRHLPPAELHARYRALADELAIDATGQSLRLCHAFNSKANSQLTPARPVQPKLPDRPRRRAQRPLLLAADPEAARGYALHYLQIVASYRAAKRAWLRRLRTLPGTVRYAGLELPPHTLLGTLPHRDGRIRAPHRTSA